MPVYVLAQLLGGIAGAALTYANYFTAISIAEGGPHIRTVPGTASIFGTYAVDYLSNVSAFFDEVNNSLFTSFRPSSISLNNHESSSSVHSSSSSSSSPSKTHETPRPSHPPSSSPSRSSSSCSASGSGSAPKRVLR